MRKNKILDLLFRLAIVIAANVLLSFATVWFLEPAKLFAGGASGIAQLIQRIFLRNGILVNVNLGWYILFVNIPIVIIGIRHVSLRFAIFSVVAVGVQTLTTLLIPAGPFSFISEEIDAIIANGEKIPVELYGVILTLAVCGGVLAGVASGVALKFGTSTGGFDIVGQALALKKNISIGIFTMSLNIIIALIGGGILQGQWLLALFTIIRMVLNGLVVDKIHTAYTFTALHIFSNDAEEIAYDIMNEMGRGCTFENVVGGFTHKESVQIYCVVSTYEIETALKIIHRYDKKAFVSMTPVKRINGRFIKKTIV